ncbi:helix-turn-helix domain-containing protein [Vibrio metschnikovii]|nr:helix-turn-helix domain-containing protein [Vibrio metschnikovii]
MFQEQARALPVLFQFLTATFVSLNYDGTLFLKPIVNKCVQTFLEKGQEGLKEKPRTGRSSFLTPEQKEQPAQHIKDRVSNP